MDILKLIVTLSALIYFNFKLRSCVSGKSFWIINIGLSLLLFASVLDFTDGIRSLDSFPVIGGRAPFHDILEDQLGDIPGLALLIFGVFRELKKRQ